MIVIVLIFSAYFYIMNRRQRAGLAVIEGVVCAVLILILKQFWVSFADLVKKKLSVLPLQ